MQAVALATPLFTQVIVNKVVVNRTQSTRIANTYNPFASAMEQALTLLIPVVGAWAT